MKPSGKSNKRIDEFEKEPAIKKGELFKHKPNKLKQLWQKLYHSTINNISRGAQHVNKIISWARKDNWRRKKK